MDIGGNDRDHPDSSPVQNSVFMPIRQLQVREAAEACLQGGIIIRSVMAYITIEYSI